VVLVGTVVVILLPIPRPGLIVLFAGGLGLDGIVVGAARVVRIE
jgi:hypothetical protein